MKPNCIILTDKGIGCIEAPEKPVMGSYYLALEAALKQVVLFKDHPNVHNQLADLLIEKQYEQGRLYPVPDEYEIKIEIHSIYNGKDNPSIEYAILVPKEEIMAEKFWSNIEKSYAHVKQPTIKQPTSIEENKWCDSCGKRTTWINGECENYKPKSSIEEAAEKAIPYHPSDSTLYQGYRKYEIKGFIAGAKSDAAKEYWYQQFKQEKK